MKKWEYFIPLILQRLSWFPVRVILLFFVKFEVYGLHYIKNYPGNNFIFAANHTSELDPIVIAAALPFSSIFLPLYFVSRDKNFYSLSGIRKIFYGGLLFRMFGAHGIRPYKKDYAKALEFHKVLLLHNRSLLIFPEGNISRDGLIHDAHGGVIYLVESTGRGIVPVTVSGLYGIKFKDIIFRRRRVFVRFGCPIFSKELINSKKSTQSSVEMYQYEASYIINNIRKSFAI